MSGNFRLKTSRVREKTFPVISSAHNKNQTWNADYEKRIKKKTNSYHQQNTDKESPSRLLLHDVTDRAFN